MYSRRTLKIARNGYIAISLVFCALGLFCILNPGGSLRWFCTLLGILFLANGVIKMIGYFSKDSYCLAFQFDFAFGILMAVVGIFILVRRESVIHLIFVVLGLMILMDALARIQMSIDAKRFGLSFWWRILLAAVLVGIFGMVLLVDPYHGAKMTMILTGVALLLEGALNLGIAVYTVRILEEN